MTLREAALAAIRKRHVERKSWPLIRNDPRGVEADGYRHFCKADGQRWPCDATALLDERDRLREVVRYFATEYLSPDASGRWGLPRYVGACSHDELDKSCPCVTAADNRMFDIEQTLTAERRSLLEAQP